MESTGMIGIGLACGMATWQFGECGGVRAIQGFGRHTSQSARGIFQSLSSMEVVSNTGFPRL